MERIKVAREAEADLGGEMRMSTNLERSGSERNKADLGGEKRIPTSTTATPSRTLPLHGSTNIHHGRSSAVPPRATVSSAATSPQQTASSVATVGELW